ncbi:MAG TPA: PaaI family thioesterase [Longimicrobiales bacterium]|nr:PaaI family thioesterase [Longimicrobiales bacterium]
MSGTASRQGADPRDSKEGILAFASQFPFFRLLGLEVLDVAPGWSRTRLEHRPDLNQPAGILHGGVMASLIDTGIAHALLMTERFRELRAENGALVSVDLRVKFFRPVSEAAVECESRVVRLGRQVIHAEAVVTGSAGKEVARGDATYMAVPGARLRRS